MIAALGEALGPRFLDLEHNACPSPRRLLGATPEATFDGHVTLPTPAVPKDWKRSADEVVVREGSTYLWWD